VKLHGASFQAVEELRTHIYAFIKDYNETTSPFAWTKPKVHQKYLKPFFTVNFEIRPAGNEACLESKLRVVLS
jgi:hypothetical protein